MGVILAPRTHMQHDYYDEPLSPAAAALVRSAGQSHAHAAPELVLRGPSLVPPRGLAKPDEMPLFRDGRAAAFAKRCMVSGALHECTAGAACELVIQLPGSGTPRTVALAASVWRATAGQPAELVCELSLIHI